MNSNEIINSLPHFHVSLNASVAVILCLGYYFIKKGNPEAHRNCMISAMTISVVFMISYLTYHAKAGYVPFEGQGLIRPFYFTLLASHVILAATFVPMIIITASRAIKGNFEKHSRIARWTLPIWLYVSVTGVIIYFMVFHLYTVQI